MKLELRENMYIRNCYGRIAKIEYIEDSIAYCDNWLYQSYEDHITFINLNDEEDINEITKASYNIIDLIEKNDYINGSWVNEIVDGKPIHEDYNDPFYSFGWENDDIKTVITHEQMEQMSYKIKE